MLEAYLRTNISQWQVLVWLSRLAGLTGGWAGLVAWLGVRGCLDWLCGWAGWAGWVPGLAGWLDDGKLQTCKETCAQTVLIALIT